MLDLWVEKKVRPHTRGAVYLLRYADDFLCMVQYADDAQRIEEALRERFATFDLELQPEKTRTVRFGRYERENATGPNRKPNPFDFVGFTHYCDTTRRGTFMVNRKTSETEKTN